MTTFFREDIKRAAEAIANGFEWDKTSQGYKYWSDVYINLLKLEDEFDEKNKL